MSVANYVGGPAAAGPLLGDRYRLGERIGSGASGQTYAAVDEQSGQDRAVKLFRTSAANAADVIGEFRRLQSLAHPNVVAVHDVGQTADGFFLVMDRVAGAALTSIAALEDAGARRQAFERVARQLADALAYLHGRDVVHADICPTNIRLDGQGNPILFDFGLALALPASDTTGAAENGGHGDSAGFGLGARGTLGYAAPEAMIGRLAPTSDLFALAATLFETWTGAAPFGTGLQAVQRMLSTRAPALSSVRAGLDERWDDLFARLLAPQPEQRPASARELLREVSRLCAGADAPVELDLRAPFPGGDPLAGIVVDRESEREQLRLLLEQLAEGAAPCSVACVAGPTGSGRRTVINLAVRDATIARAASLLPPFILWRGGLDRLALYLEVAGGSDEARRRSPLSDASHATDDRFALLADALERHAALRPICVVLDGDSSATAAFAAFVAGAEPSGRVLILLAAQAPVQRRFARNVLPGPLGAPSIEQLISRASGQPPPPGATRAISAASGGHAAMVAALARQLVQAIRGGEGDRFLGGLEREGAPDLRAVLEATFASFQPATRRLLASLALFGHDGSPPELGLHAADQPAARTEARRAGWLVAEPEAEAGAREDLPGSLHREVVVAALADAKLRDLATQALVSLPASDPNRARALIALGETDAAARSLRDRARTQDAPDAAPLLEHAAALAPHVLTFDDSVLMLTGLAILGRYPQALATLDQLAATNDDPARAAVLAERRAWLLGRRGDLAGAQEVLERALAAGDPGRHQSNPIDPVPLRARLARVLISLGRLPQALEVVAPSLNGAATDPGVAAALEAAILAHAYAGVHEPARALHGRLLAAHAGHPSGRIVYLGALIDQLGGRLQAAVPQYREALQLCAAKHDVHTLATVALNLGALLAEQGLYAEALAATERAIRELGRLGSTAELGTALLNAANLFVVLGELGSARRMLARARDEAAARGAPAALAFARFVEGDLERRRGQPHAAAGLYRAAARELRQQGQRAAAASAIVAEVEALCQAGAQQQASAALAGLLISQDTAPDSPEIERARARLLLAGAAPVDPADTAQALAPRLQRQAEADAADGRRPVAWRTALCAARLFHQLDDQPSARQSLARARHLFQEIQMATAEPFRPGLTSDPDAFWLRAADAPAAQDSGAALRAAQTENRLRRLLRINKRLNSELRLPRLLETIIDTVIELTDAERGFILLEDESGELAVRVARNIDQRTLETPELALSRSIARRAAAGGEPIVTIDATGDDRFKEAISVSDLHLRSVLAVPLLIKGRSAGTIYVDHRLRKGAFDQEDVNLVLDFAEQAAIALENARLLTQLRRRERQVEALNRRLEVELSARREELSGMKQELRENREALAVRYDYRNIVGRTPRMLELFRLLDRITDTTLPVVIQGESGTGKELVARALHFNGPRRERPFVSENCAAIPETLLESTLFGYVRGAFTGADHDTRGLFEVADGGTLFLDEIGEMSPAMQGKLLRVLQEGEFRRVGGERTRKVDVRIVAATNRDLARLVEEGKFRQDLYFRLSVARIFLPPLRERREDIPLIVEHLLAKHGAGAARKPMHPAALNSLTAYRWPGNVRELENEIMRAVALSAETITLGDLSPAVAAHGDGAAAAPENPDSLLLRPRVERLERSLLREALGRCDNNQTRAADALGLSRFGLQKKLKRYRLA